MRDGLTQADQNLQQIRSLCGLIDYSAPASGTLEELQAWCSRLIADYYGEILEERTKQLAAVAWNHIEQSARILHIAENAARAQDPWPDSVEALLVVGSHCRAEASDEHDLDWMLIVSEQQHVDGLADVCDQIRRREDRLFSAYDLREFVEYYFDALTNWTRVKCFTPAEITSDLADDNRASLGSAIVALSLASPSPDTSAMLMSELRRDILTTLRPELGSGQLCPLLYKLFEQERLDTREPLYRMRAMTRRASARVFSALSQSLAMLFADPVEVIGAGSLDGSGRIFPYWLIVQELDRLELSPATKRTIAIVALQISLMRSGRDDVAEGLEAMVSALTRSILAELNRKDLGIEGGKINQWLSTLASSPYGGPCAGVCP